MSHVADIPEPAKKKFRKSIAPLGGKIAVNATFWQEAGSDEEGDDIDGDEDELNEEDGSEQLDDIFPDVNTQCRLTTINTAARTIICTLHKTTLWSNGYLRHRSHRQSTDCDTITR